MQWNLGYTIFEKTVVGAYDLGKLDRHLLGVLMEPYRNKDIEVGGDTNMESVDGKSVQEIVVEIMTGEVSVRPTVDEQEDPQAWYNYQEELYAKFFKITRANFGWS